MREQTLRIYRLLILYLLVSFMLGCGAVTYKPKMKKADDAISKAIYEKVGEKVSYEERNETKYGALQYRYILLDNDDKDLLPDMVGAINGVLDEESKKVDLCIVIVTPSALETVAVISNYDRDSEDIDDTRCGYLYCLRIWGSDRDDENLYNQAFTYPTMEGIEYLKVVEKVSKDAEKDGIDWYEVFPDLKGYEIFRQDNTGTTIIYQEMRGSEEIEEESLLEP